MDTQLLWPFQTEKVLISVTLPLHIRVLFLLELYFCSVCPCVTELQGLVGTDEAEVAERALSMPTVKNIRSCQFQDFASALRSYGFLPFTHHLLES